MNANDLVTMLNDQGFLQKQDAKLLEKIVEKHPYFFVAKILLFKKSLNQTGANGLLNDAAITTGDRAMLYHFMQEKSPPEKLTKRTKEEFVAPGKKQELTTVENENEDLMEMLKSIHERKLAFLGSQNSEHDEKISEEKEKINLETQSGISEQYELSEVSISDSEFAMNKILLEEEGGDNAEELSSEIESMHELDSVMSEQTEFDLQEDFLLTNETSGAGAEFVPTDFLNSENANEDFTIESDAEIQSMNEMEGKIIFRDSGYEVEEKKPEIPPEVETPLHIESRNLIGFETEDISYEEIDTSKVSEENTVGQLISESDAPKVSEINSENVIGDEKEKIKPIEQRLEKDSLHINEHVSSPGEFLPDKSYTYSEWLHFFRYDSAEKRSVIAETPEKKELPKQPQAERAFGATMQLELESIDRIVSTIKVKTEKGAKEIFPEELAKKSLELNEEIVSETLAQIYEEQGRFDKAIRQYVKLSLIYPEKVSFFATRIKELKGKK